MKNFYSLLIFIVFLIGCGLNTPKTFSETALQQEMYQQDNSKIKFQEILKQNKGHKILVNVWASWCRDCIEAIPKLKALQKSFPNVKYVFVSTDRNFYSWKKAISKYKIDGDHYFLENGMNNDFGDFLNSNWVPRYLVVNEIGFVDLFKAKQITDVRIVNALKK